MLSDIKKKSYSLFLHKESTLNIFPPLIMSFGNSRCSQCCNCTFGPQVTNFLMTLTLLCQNWLINDLFMCSSVCLMNLPILKELYNADDIILFLGKILDIPSMLNTGLLWQEVLRVKPMKRCVICCELRERAESSLCCLHIKHTRNVEQFSFSGQINLPHVCKPEVRPLFLKLESSPPVKMICGSSIGGNV